MLAAQKINIGNIILLYDFKKKEIKMAIAKWLVACAEIKLYPLQLAIKWWVMPFKLGSAQGLNLLNVFLIKLALNWSEQSIINAIPNKIFQLSCLYNFIIKFT